MEDEDISMGEKIRRQRVIKGFSQESVAFELGISQNAYSKIERNETEVSVKRIYQIAKALNVPVQSLLPKSFDFMALSLYGMKQTWKRLKSMLRKEKKETPIS
jgi:transcriptional regulator with XRE-family HTH domain